MTGPSTIVGERAAGSDLGVLVARGQRIQRGKRRARGRQNDVGEPAGTYGTLHRFDVRIEAAQDRAIARASGPSGTSIRFT
jgi:hypothetical protein